MMDDLKAWIKEIAYDRIDQIERQLNASPEAFPEFAAVAQKIDAAMDETNVHPDAKLTERDDLWMTYLLHWRWKCIWPALGTVGAYTTHLLHVDDIGTIHVAWDCGSTLGVVYGVDSCTVVHSEGEKRND